MLDKLIDTNILVYAYDTSEGTKHETAKHLHLWDATIAVCMKENGVIDIVTENKADFEKIPDIHVIFPF